MAAQRRQADAGCVFDLSYSERAAIWDLLEKMPYYKEIEAGGRNYVLLHGGLENFSPNRPPGDYTRDEIVWAEPDFDAEYFPDKYLVIGHTPTIVIGEGAKIFRKGRLIDIDCGAAYKGGVLGCLRLDDFCEFYV